MKIRGSNDIQGGNFSQNNSPPQRSTDSSWITSPTSKKEKNKYADIMLSPIRYGQRKFRPGGTSGSTFSLIAATLGSGTISFAYIVMKLGYALGPILIVLGACISYYTGMLIVKFS